MRAILSVLVLVTTATSTNHTLGRVDGGSCTPSTLSNAKAPSWPIPHDITVDATKILENITQGDQDILIIIARNLLANRPELIAVILAAPHKNPVLAFKKPGKLITFLNRTAESEMFWNTVDNADTGWAPPFRECNIFPAMWLHAFVVKSASSGAVGVFLPVKINQCDDSVADMFGGNK